VPEASSSTVNETRSVRRIDGVAITTS